jgi:hypothetical protein
MRAGSERASLWHETQPHTGRLRLHADYEFRSKGFDEMVARPD